MDEETAKGLAAQLRQPNGEYAIRVGEMMNEGNKHINLYTIEALDPKAGEKILEIGMGNGFFVMNILGIDPSIRYTGCDFSEIMVEESRKQNEQFIQNGQAEFFHANAEQLPLPNETFDKVFTINTLYFWENPELVFAEIRRVLKPKGKLIIAVRPKSVMQHYPFVKYGFAMFAKEDIVNLMGRNQFRATEILEKQEPEAELNGEKMSTETLIISAEKEPV